MQSSELAGGPVGKAAQAALNAYRSSVKKAASNVAGFTPALDLNAFSLEAPSKILQPFAAPIRNMLPRVPMNPKSDVARWKVLNGIRPQGLASVSTSTGVVGPNILKTSTDRTATMKKLSLSDFVIDDARLFASGYEDVQATADLLLLNMIMEAEDRQSINGNVTALAAPTGLAGALGGAASGALSAGQTFTTIRVTALTLQGLHYSRTTPLYAGHDLAATLQNGESVVSAAFGPLGPTAANDSLALSWTAVPDAVAYNVYIDKGAGEEWVGTFQLNNITISSDWVGGNAPPVGDTSADPNAFEGLLQQLRAAGAPQFSLDGASLTATAGSKNIVEFLDQMQTAYSSFQVGPDQIWVSPEIARNIPEKIGGASAPAVSIRLDSGETVMRGGLVIDTILNPFTGEAVQIKTHPTFPAGLVIGLKMSSPYDHARLSGAAVDMLVAEEFTRTTFAKTSYKVDFAIHTDEVLRVRSALGSWVLTNVGA